MWRHCNGKVYCDHMWRHCNGKVCCDHMWRHCNGKVYCDHIWRHCNGKVCCYQLWRHFNGKVYCDHMSGHCNGKVCCDHMWRHCNGKVCCDYFAENDRVYHKKDFLRYVSIIYPMQYIRGVVTRKMFPFDDVNMCLYWIQMMHLPIFFRPATLALTQEQVTNPLLVK